MLDIVETAQTTGDVARRQRLAFQRFNDADHVDRFLDASVLDAKRLDDSQREIFGLKSEECGTELATIFGVHRQSKAATLGQNEKRHWMKRHESRLEAVRDVEHLVVRRDR